MNRFTPLLGFSSALLCALALGCSSQAPPSSNPERGAEAAAGSAGSSAPSGPDPVVLPCDSLDSSDEPTWQLITPPGDLGDGQAIRVHPNEAGTLFVMMHKGGNGAHSPTDGLYKSTDCGATWSSQLNTGANGDAVARGSWWSFVIDPVDPEIIYTIDGYGAGGVWKSTNGGVDWVQTIPDEPGKYIPTLFLNGLAMDPTDRLHLVATAHVKCTAPYEGGCLPETFDGGDSWHLLKGPDGDWSEGAGAVIIDKKRLLYATGFGGLSLTTDDGQTWQRVAESAYPSLYTAPDGTFYMTSNNGIIKSIDAVNWASVPGAGRSVPIAGGDATFFAADQWSGNYFRASASNPSQIEKFTNQGMPESAQGAPFLAYDNAHHVLYSSNFGGGVWRIVAP